MFSVKAQVNLLISVFLCQIREVEGKLQQDPPRCSSPAPPPCPGPPASNMAVVPQDDMPVCKIAERVVLRKMDNNRQITGSQLATYGVTLLNALFK